MARPTLIDVGIEANVSAITVSRAIRQPDKVSRVVRERVEAAIKKLGYVPNVAASNLASRTSNIIGMMFHQSKATCLRMLLPEHMRPLQTATRRFRL